MSMKLNNINILKICVVGYCYIINGISKSEDMSLLRNDNTNVKSETLNFSLLFIKDRQRNYNVWW